MRLKRKKQHEFNSKIENYVDVCITSLTATGLPSIDKHQILVWFKFDSILPYAGKVYFFLLKLHIESTMLPLNVPSNELMIEKYKCTV